MSKQVINSVDPQDAVIELARGDSFEQILIGTWTLQENQLFFKEGLLASTLDKNPKRLVLRNPPLNNPEFIRFAREFALNHPEGPKLLFYQGIDLSPVKQYLEHPKAPELPEHHQLLNSENVSQFLGQYTLENGVKLFSVFLASRWFWYTCENCSALLCLLSNAKPK